MQDRPLPEPLNLSVHITRKHQSKHLEIAEKGPKRMPERRRNIPLHEKMAVPRQSVPRERHTKQKPPIEQQRAEEEEDRS
ncbi:hypothetical protein DVH24_036076 [Malus domestica]|uniref:Uncharacterized protein n=1 Tax=Malus domestica TaxID=3750 RepID=A0A498IHW3_MALDO|nr:hypothetical protein DVH24_036076 [Malus domestica]